MMATINGRMAGVWCAAIITTVLAMAMAGCGSSGKSTPAADGDEAESVDRAENQDLDEASDQADSEVIMEDDADEVGDLADHDAEVGEESADEADPFGEQDQPTEGDAEAPVEQFEGTEQIEHVEHPAACDKARGTLTCEELAQGDTAGAAEAWDTYSKGLETFEADGPEHLYWFDAACDGWTTFSLNPSNGLDLSLFILDDCDPDSLLAYNISGDQPMNLTVRTREGRRYYVVVDGQDGDAGAYSLTTACSFTQCEDLDEDGYFAYHWRDCPEGDDCDDDDDDVHPDATEIICDSIDQDCQGGDECDHIACVDNDTDGFFRYDPVSCPMGTDCNDRNFAIKPGAEDGACDGVDQNCDGMDHCPGTGIHCDACLPGFKECAEGFECYGFVEPAGDEYGWPMLFCIRNCSADGRCPYGSFCIDTGEESYCWPRRTASCDGNQLSFTDACGHDLGSYQCGSAPCDDNAGVCVRDCGALSGAITAGTPVAAHTSNGSNVMSMYGCQNIGEHPGAEMIYQFTASCAGRAAATLDVLTDVYLDLIVLADACDTASCAAASDWGQDRYHKEVRFDIVAGQTYFLVVDDEHEDGAGGFFAVEVQQFCTSGQKTHCAACVHDFSCAGDAFCHQADSETDDAPKVCAADCSHDGQCPADSQCRQVATGRYACIPDLVGSCIGQQLWADDACGNHFKMMECPADTVCSAATLSCLTTCVDNDGDGYYGYDAALCPSGDDCNDAVKSIHPGATDIRCNSVDEDCSGVDNCSDNGQCEPCEGGHCAPGYLCFTWPGDTYSFCAKDCTMDHYCPGGDVDLVCSGVNDESMYCKPALTATCSGGVFTLADDCGHTRHQATCDYSCFAMDEDYGCVNYCPAATTFTGGCGGTVKGDTRTGVNRNNYYYSNVLTQTGYWGPELTYRYDATCGGQVSLRIDSAADLSVFVIKGGSSASATCKNSAMIDFAWSDGDNMASFIAEAGKTYFFVVDGWRDNAGPFTLSLTCVCSTCADNDHDGHDGYNPATCPQGDDCDDDNNQIYKGRAEILCDDVDQDCSGYDLCPTASCQVDEELTCNAGSTQGDRSGQSNDITFYAEACTPYAKDGGEVVYHVKASCSGKLTAKLSQVGDQDIDLFILEGACRADACLTHGWYEASVDAVSGTDYYIVVDGPKAHESTYALSVACACFACQDKDDDGHDGYDETACPAGDDCDDDDDDVYPGAAEISCDDIDQDCDDVDLCETAACTQDGTLTCGGGVIHGDTTGQSSQIGLYGGACATWPEAGGEMVYRFEPTCSGLTTVSLDFDTMDGELDLFVMEGTCVAASCTNYADTSVTFMAEEGTVYFVAVDGPKGSELPFTLTTSCSCK